MLAFLFFIFIFLYKKILTNIVRDLFIPLARHVVLSLKITGFGTGCNFFCLSMQGF
jgi:hypothetical protein